MRLTSLSTVYTDYSHRMRVGLYPVDEMTSTYAVENFEVQTDQAARNMPWFRPVDPSGVVKEYQTISESIAMTRQGQGKPSFSWYFSAETPGMIMYTWERIMDSRLWTPATVMTWSRLHGWVCVQCRALWNEPADVAEPKGAGGFKGIKIDFVECVDAPET